MPVDAPPRARKKSHWLRTLTILLLVLVVLVIAADRIGDAVAERIAADNLQSSQHLSQRPDVDIHGVPFLTQFATGDYDHISLDAKSVPVANGAVRLSTLHVDLNQLHVSRDFHRFHANSATAVATLTYAALSSRLHVQVRYAGDGRIQASKKLDLPVIGTIDPTISVQPQLVNGALGFGKATINGASNTGDVVSSVLNKVFGIAVPLDGIPFQIKVRSLTAGSSGLVLKLVGSDLTYNRDGS